MNGTAKPLGYPELDGVSCPGLKSCFAVGDSTLPNDIQHPFVEHWNGRGHWSLMNGVPSPSSMDALVGVSCPSTRSCFAVGAVSGSSIPYSLVEHWNGRGGWSVMTGPHVATDSVLWGVSCPSRTSCFAVGGDFTHTWVEHWDGAGSWELMPSPNPPHSWLRGVTCPTATACIADGTQNVHPKTFRTLVEQYG